MILNFTGHIPQEYYNQLLSLRTPYGLAVGWLTQGYARNVSIWVEDVVVGWAVEFSVPCISLPMVGRVKTSVLSVYVREDFRGGGIAKQLLDSVVENSEETIFYFSASANGKYYYRDYKYPGKTFRPFHYPLGKENFLNIRQWRKYRTSLGWKQKCMDMINVNRGLCGWDRDNSCAGESWYKRVKKYTGGFQYVRLGL